MYKLLKNIALIVVFFFVVIQIYNIYTQEIAANNIVVYGQSSSEEQFESTETLQLLDNQHEKIDYTNNDSSHTSLQTQNANSNSLRNLYIATSIFAFFCIILVFLLIRILKRKHKLSDRLMEIEHHLKQKSREIALSNRQKEHIQSSLSDTLKTLREANELKDNFLANISHEIRTPLNGIIGFSNLISEKALGIGDKTLINHSKLVLSSSERLFSFLTNIIDFSRIEANDLNLTFDSCNISQIAKYASEAYIFTANEKKLQLILNLPSCKPVMANCKYLSKVISDIINNAIKYTEKGFVKISTSNSPEPSEVVISIEDTGIGIDPDYLDHVFEAFRQESAGMTRKFEGGGLALPLSKKLIEIMGGRIEINSVKGKGTIVNIHMKKSFEKIEALLSSPPYDTAIKQALHFSQQPNTFLLIEDDSINGELIEAYLLGYAKTIIVKNGVEALRIIEEFHKENKLFDGFLVDINLPQEWDGISLRNEIIRRWHDYSRIPFIAQTAYAMSGDRKKFIDAGFDDYIAKPIIKKTLIATIDSVLKKKFQYQ